LKPGISVSSSSSPAIDNTRVSAIKDTTRYYPFFVSEDETKNEKSTHTLSNWALEDGFIDQTPFIPGMSMAAF